MSASAHSRQPPLRLVLDTNIVVAGLLWNGPPRRLIEWAIEGKAVELFSSPVLLDELAHTLGYSKFAGRTLRHSRRTSKRWSRSTPRWFRW